MVRRRRCRRAGGLRTDRDLRGVVAEPAAGLPVRHRRLDVPGDRRQDRRRWGDPAQGAGCDERLPRPAGRDGRGDRLRRLVPHRRHRRTGCRGLPADHRPQEGHVQDLAGQIRCAVGDFSPVQGICPFASEIIVYGEGKPYCVALVSLDGEAIREWADRNGFEGKSFEEVARDEKTRELIGGYVDTLNKHLNRWERVKRFSIIDRELTVEAGDLTRASSSSARPSWTTSTTTSTSCTPRPVPAPPVGPVRPAYADGPDTTR